MKISEFDRLANRLKPLLKKGVRENVFSGGAAGILVKEKRGKKKLIITCGTTGKNPESEEVGCTTLFDLASLTKPLCTTLGIAHLVHHGCLSWQSKTGTFLSCPEPLAELSVQHLLSHSAGLIAYKPFFRDFEPVIKNNNTDILLQKICTEKLKYRPGTQCVYSDPGFIVLGRIIEEISDTNLDTFFKKNITEPAGIEKQVFFRSPIRREQAAGVMETGYCSWRGRYLQGEVHDEHCWLMNGVAGHAGLFGTVDGVLTLCELIYDVWRGELDFQAFDREILQKIMRRQYRDHTWCLGFDTPSANGSSAGSGFSRTSIGHLGFTGTSFWMDLKRGLIVVLLTNRVCMSNNSKRIQAFRPDFHDTITKYLSAYE